MIRVFVHVSDGGVGVSVVGVVGVVGVVVPA